MKKSIAAMLLALATITAQATGPGHYRPAPHYHGHHHSHSRWIAPLIIGGVIGYTMSRPAPAYPYTPPAPVVIVPPPEPVPAYPPPVGFHYEQRLDAGCNCWRWFVVGDRPAY